MGQYFEVLEIRVGNDIKSSGREIDTIRGLTWKTLHIIFLDSLAIIFTKFTMYIVVILLSPITALLSERVEKIITGNKYNFSFRQLIHDIKRGVRIAFRNMFWEYFFVIIIMGLAAFFGGNLKDIVLFSFPVAIGFYFYGFAFIDYINERRRLNIQQSVYFVSKHKGLAIAIGSIYSVFFLSFFYILRLYERLPAGTGTQFFWGALLVISFILAAVAPILAITSATLSMHELVNLTQNEYAIKSNVIVPNSDEEGVVNENISPEEQDSVDNSPPD